MRILFFLASVVTVRAVVRVPVRPPPAPFPCAVTFAAPVEIHNPPSLPPQVCWADDQAKSAMSSLLRSECCSRFQSYQQLSIGDVLDAVHQSQAPSSGDKTKSSQPNVQLAVEAGAAEAGRGFNAEVVDQRRRSRVQSFTVDTTTTR